MTILHITFLHLFCVVHHLASFSISPQHRMYVLNSLELVYCIMILGHCTVTCITNYDIFPQGRIIKIYNATHKEKLLIKIG